MQLHYVIGFSSKASRIFSSNLAINKIVYGGTKLVPIVVSRNCLKVFSSNSKMLLFSIVSASSIRKSLEICLLSLNFKMWNVRIKTNNVNSTQNRGNFPKLFNLLRKWLVRFDFLSKWFLVIV